MGSGYKSIVTKLVHYFIPENQKQDIIAFTNAKLRAQIILVTFGLYFIYCFNLYMYTEVKTVLILAALISIGISAILFKKGYPINIVTHVYMVGNAINIFGECFYSGGFTFTPALLLIPAGTMLLGSLRIAKIWLVITLLFVVLLYILSLNHYEFPIVYKDEYKYYLQFTNNLGILIAGFAIMWIFQKQKSDAVEVVDKLNKEIEIEKYKSDKLLLNILPSEVADELKLLGKATPRYHEQAIVMFTDIKSFTEIAEKMSPEELVSELDTCFTAFDNIIEKYDLEKIKTIGDAYMCVSGVPDSTRGSAKNMVFACFEILDFIKAHRFKNKNAQSDIFEIRLGIHAGSVVSGVVGQVKFAFDIWGDTVNIAARMESGAEVGKINISRAMYELIKNDFECELRGTFEVKNRGSLEMFTIKPNM